MEFVFIDTSIFINSNYFLGNQIKGLFKLAEQGEIRIILTQIVVDEIHRRAKGDIENKVVRFKNIKKDIRLLESIGAYKNVFNTPNIDDEHINLCVSEFLKNLDKNLNRKGVEVLKYGEVHIEHIFKKYFNTEPPFSTKKKSEFPDAFSLYMLEDWCKVNNKKCIVLTTDSDLLKYNSSYLKIPSEYKSFLNDALIRIDNRDYTRKRVKDALQLVETKKAKFISEIEENIRTDLGDGYYYSFDSYPFINEVYIDKLDVSIVDLKVVSVSKDNVEIEARVDISFDITQNVDDEESSVYDIDERGRIYHTVDHNINKSGTIYIPINVFTPPAGKQFTDAEMDISSSSLLDLLR